MYKIISQAVEFYWEVEVAQDAIIANCAEWISGVDGETFAKLALTPSDYPILKEYLEMGFRELFLLFIKHSTPESDSLFFDKVDSEDDTCHFAGLTLKIASNSDGDMVVNPSRLRLVDCFSRDFISYYVLSRWAKGLSLESLQKIFELELFKASEQIRNNLFYLRAVAYRPSFVVS